MQSDTANKVVMIMVDGFGIPPEGWNHSFYAKHSPPEFIEIMKHYSVPIDACLGVPGIPQSATGQTSFFCGINAPQIMGRHVHAFPGESLREQIRKKNIFKAVMASGKRAVFANAYVARGLEELEHSSFRSVTTVMTATTIAKVFRSEELIQGEAVFHDITNENAPEEYHISQISPEQAADNLIGISKKYDLTLFEHFMTDRGGHKKNRDLLPHIIEVLSRFIVRLCQVLPDTHILILSSDHGNCEDTSSYSHTCNPVPLLVFGKKRPNNIIAESIKDIYNLTLNALTNWQ